MMMQNLVFIQFEDVLIPKNLIIKTGVEIETETKVDIICNTNLSKYIFI